MAAGLYDRAEDMFKQLVDETDFRLGALQQLLQIYQATSDWQSAIEVAERLVKLGKEKHRGEIANFWCELALQQMAANDLDKAMALLRKAPPRTATAPGYRSRWAGCGWKRATTPKRWRASSGLSIRIKSWWVKRWRCCRPATSSSGKTDEWEVFCAAAWRRTPGRPPN